MPKQENKAATAVVSPTPSPLIAFFNRDEKASLSTASAAADTKSASVPKLSPGSAATKT